MIKKKSMFIRTINSVSGHWYQHEFVSNHFGWSPFTFSVTAESIISLPSVVREKPLNYMEVSDI